ncbi:MAG TPA: hypothetical protein VE441_10900 [Mycobacterium sp.]|jgi:hypothetical protein|nr:hypothetical protein [Mycobacterium sp.]
MRQKFRSNQALTVSPRFFLEGDGAGQRLEVATADEAIRVIQEWLGNSI